MIGSDLNKAIQLLEADELVAIPTETVYGLGGNAFSDRAVVKIFAAKNRPSFDPLIVHTSHWERLEELVQEIPEKIQLLAEAFMPGPLSLLLPKKDRIPDIVTSGSPIVAVRIPAHPLTQQLLSQLSFPLAAPSANPFGYISPTTARHVEQQLGTIIPYILDGGACTIGLESTIVGMEDGQPTVFRKGGISVEAIEQRIGKVKVKSHSTSNPQAPGMLKSHYAPRVPLELGEISRLIQKYAGQRLGILSFQNPYPEIPADQQVILSSEGSFSEAARQLFAGLRYLDNLEIDRIVAELLPEKDLGRAINDRLRRASAG